MPYLYYLPSIEVERVVRDALEAYADSLRALLDESGGHAGNPLDLMEAERMLDELSQRVVDRAEASS